MQTEGIIWAGLYVQDMEQQAAYYKDVIGLRLIRQAAGWADFDAGGGAMFELLEGGAAVSAPKDAAQQSMLIGLRVPDLEAAMTELKGRGVTFLGEPGSYKNQRWAYFHDPEGNRIELKQIS